MALCSLVLQPPHTAVMELEHSVCGPGSGMGPREETGLQEVTPVHS